MKNHNQYHTIIALVEDKPGVLTRVASLFRRRGFNIASLAVGHSEKQGLSRMTFVVEGDEYTVDQATVLQHHTEALIYTVPIVAYGLFRYLYVLHHHEVGQDASREMFKDLHLLGTVVVWLLSVVLILGWNG